MRTYENLLELSENLIARWSTTSGAAASHTELTMLLSACRLVDPLDLKQLPTVAHIVSKADVESEIGRELDTNAFFGWSQAIIDELEGSDKQYAYRPKGDDWEVNGVSLCGEEDWVATVVTETIAQKLLNVLSGNSQMS